MKATFGVLAMVLILAAMLGTVLGVSLVPSPRSETCEALLGGLPATIPQTVILRVRNDQGALVDPAIAPSIARAFEEAADIFGLAGRIVVDLGGLNYSESPLAHVLLVGVLSKQRLHTGLMENHGRMCGNLVLLALTSKPELDRRIVVHEVGHFLGLSHEEGTWMTPRALDGSANTDRFSEKQLEILRYWDRIGEPYVPHWQWRAQGAGPPIVPSSLT